MLRLFFFFVLVLSGPVRAATFTATGDVYRISALAEELTYDDLLLIDGFSSAGVCNVATEGMVILRIRDNPKGERQFSMAVAARLAGKQVQVQVTDSSADSRGDCYLRWIRLTD